MKRKILTGMVLAIAIVGIITFFFLRDSGSGDYVLGGVDQQDPGVESAAETAGPGAGEKPGAETSGETGEEEETAGEEEEATQPLLVGRVVGEGQGIAGANVRLYSTREIEVLMNRVERIVPQGGQMPDIPALLEAVRGELERFRTMGTVVTTDDAGRFELLEGVPGGYFILTIADGWIFKYGDVVSIDPERTAEVTIQLERGSRISGRVVSTSGLGIPGATVVAEYRPPGLPGVGKIVGRVLRMVNGEFLKGPFSAVTAEGGGFSLDSLPPGLYDLAASTIEGVESRLEMVQSGTDGAVVVLGGPATLRGFLVDDDDLPVGGVVIDLEPIEERISLPPMAAGFSDLANTFNHYMGYLPEKTLSSADGSFIYRQLGAGKYRLSIQQPGLLPTVKEATVDWEENVSIGLVRVNRGKKISGIVRSETGAPLAGATVIASPESSNFLTMGSMMNDFATGRLQVDTGADGTFSVTGLRRKRYKLNVTKQGFAPASKKSIMAGAEEPVELVLVTGLTVKGRVLVAGKDKPLAGARVEARGVRTVSDDDGYFVLEGVIQRDPDEEGFGPFGGNGGGFGGRPRGRPRQAEAGDEDEDEEPESRADLDFSVTARMKGYGGRRVELLFADVPDLVELELSPAPAITGVVYDPEGNPAPAALVRLSYPFPEELESLGFFDTSMIFKAVTVSDRNGRFSFSDFSSSEDSEYRMIADHVSYARGYSETFSYSPEFDPDNLVEIRLEAGGEIAGLVTSGGQPVAGATLRLRRRSLRERSTQEQMFTNMLGLPKGGEEARTNSKGEYSYSNVGIGQYTISAEVSGFKESSEEEVVIEGGDSKAIDFDLDPGGSISGTVLDAVGTVLAGAKVRLLKLENQPEGFRRAQKYFGGSYKSTVTEDDGTFSIDGLPEGAYSVIAEKGGYRQEELEGVSPGDDGVRIVLVLSAALLGRVTDQATGAPLTSFRLTLQHEGSSSRFPWGGSREINDPDGRFKREDLEPGRYEVKLRAAGYVSFSTELDIVQGERLEQNFFLVRAGRLGGVITDQATGTPLRGAFVKLVPDTRPLSAQKPATEKGISKVGESAEAETVDEAKEREEDTRAMFDYYNNTNLGGAEKTAADGSFLIDTVPSGPQRVLVSHPDYVQFEGRVEVALGDAVEMQFSLSPGMHISGQVQDEAGEARRGIVVFIRGATEDNRLVRKADTTDAEGSFRIEGIASGRYRVFAVVRGGGARSEPQVIDLARSKDDFQLVLPGSNR